ncbi:polysaccharide pyruvyl transferase family protein [Rhodobacter lacus]|uniref:Polysaccharide pyruvyl transferase family protein n=1 Tax=Rhodobacter lacus TaxID=1641972 RepID=A0ABW5A9B3_9RHOB
MSKLYLDMPYIGRVTAAYRKPAAELAAVSGMNLGNFVFRHALWNILEDLDTFRPVTGGEYRKIIETDPAERLIISCANWLGQTAQDEAHNRGRADIIEKCEGPVTAFGLGTQAPLAKDGEPVKVRLGPETSRLAKIISERSASISVRDQLTAETLEGIGVTNVTVTGCPSNFLNPDPDLGAQLIRKAKHGISTLNGWEDVRLAISEANGGHGATGAVLKYQLRMLAETPAFYVVQTPQLVDFATGARTNISDLYRSHNPFAAMPNKLTRTMKAKVIYFADVEAWMDFSRTCDMSTGMRIHGTMVPLQSGTPSILLGHDSRTSGLADTMGVPWITPETYLDIMPKGPKAMLSLFIERIAGFDRRRGELAGTMLDFVQKNGLNPHPGLVALAESGRAAALSDA